MTYNVFSGTLNPTHLLTVYNSAVRERQKCSSKMERGLSSEETNTVCYWGSITGRCCTLLCCIRPTNRTNDELLESNVFHKIALSRGSMLKWNYFKEFQTRSAAVGRPSYFYSVASAVAAIAIPSLRLSVARWYWSKRRHVTRCSLHCQIAKCV